MVFIFLRKLLKEGEEMYLLAMQILQNQIMFRNGKQKWIKRYEEPGKQSAADILQIKNNHSEFSSASISFQTSSRTLPEVTALGHPA